MHVAALGILERQGLRVLSARGRSVLAAAGASVDETSHMVRLDPAMVSRALATVPAEVTLIGRDPARSSRVGGHNVVFAPVAGPPSVSDLERGNVHALDVVVGKYAYRLEGIAQVAVAE